MCVTLGEDGLDGDYVVHVVVEIEEARVCADVRVFGRVDSGEVLELDEDGAVRRGQ